MESIDLALLTVVTSETPRRAEMSSSDAKTEAGFAGVLAGQEERVEVDSESNKVKPAKPKEKAADKVESRERDRIASDDSKESDIEMEGDNLFQQVPFQEASSEETHLGERVHLDEEIFLGEELSQVVENEDKDTANLDRQSVSSDLLGKSGDLPEQNDLLARIQGGDGEGQVSFVADSVVMESSELESVAATDNLTLKNGESINDNQILASISLAADKTESGRSTDKEVELTKESQASSVLNDEPGSMSLAKDMDPELKLVAGIKSAEADETEENSIHVENEQISNNDSQEPVIAAADFVELKVGDESGRQIKNGPESLFDTQAHKGNISLNGSVAAEIPEDVKIHINNEITAARDKSENGAVRSGQGLRNSSLSGGETGTVHLQGRARENQSTFIQGEQNLINYSDSKPDLVDEKFSFSGISKEIVEEQANLSTSVQAGVKEKQFFENTASGSNDLAAVNLADGKESLVKSGSEIISAKPLPISDDHLMDQIQTGLTRQVRGRQTVTIKLWPESLGKVDVKLVLREQQLSATFMVEQSDVKDAMLRKIDSLRDGLSMRGIDVKDIDVKVTPPKSGDGPSVTVGDQRQENADVWRQYHHDDFSQSGSTSPDGGENGNEDSISLSDNLSADIISSIDRGVISGSLHITA